MTGMIQITTMPARTATRTVRAAARILARCTLLLGLPQYTSLVKHIVHLKALETALEGLRIVTSALGNKAGVIGAAALARHRFHDVE